MATETPKYKRVPKGATCVYGAGKGRSGTACGKPATHLRGGSKTPYCGFHYTVLHMKDAARSGKKPYYTRETHIFLLFKSMDENGVPRCGRPRCRKQLTWHGDADRKGDEASLQHYHQRPPGILCSACNTSHFHTTAPEDIWFNMGPDEEWCWDCERVRPVDDFYKKTLHGCKECAQRRRREAWAANIQDPGYRKAHAEKARARYQSRTPEQVTRDRERAAAYHKEQYANNPEYRAKRRENLKRWAKAKYNSDPAHRRRVRDYQNAWRRQKRGRGG